MPSTSGSSPLARGLHDRGVLPSLCWRIIPARAGFTPPAETSSRRWRDHPRSRGVYRTMRRTIKNGKGSSPLARGLRSSTSRPRRSLTDHPRSRGVYITTMITLGRCQGSSPLARGLHDVTICRRDHDGIIPARAGFTPAPAEPTAGAPDHPRSRGVYSATDTGVTTKVGSSPLARGLRYRCPHDRRPDRDHPRSRGVYSFCGLCDGKTSGSSPLARGLRDQSVPGLFAHRIIPARAGFTQRAPCSRPPVPDHPRSRGVYYPKVTRIIYDEGSSSLARGLLEKVRAAVSDVRIIPARAGFTAGGAG